jgi:cytochrome P450
MKCPAQDARGDRIQKPSSLPDDAVRLNTYGDLSEMHRHPLLCVDESWDATRPFTDRSLFMIPDESAHIARRRAIGKIATPAALTFHREEVLIPLMRETLEELRRRPDEDGLWRADLMAMMKHAFVRFVGALIGTRRALTPEGADELLRIFDDIQKGYRVKYVTDPEEKRAGLKAGVAARRAFIRSFYEEAELEWRGRLARLDAAEITEADLPHDLLGLMLRSDHPDLAEPDVRVNEMLMVLLAGVDTSAAFLVHLVDEVTRWIDMHPEDQDRCDEPAFLRACGHETLRLHGPFPTTARVALQDITLRSGIGIAKGQHVYGAFIDGNSDPQVWGPDAACFDPYRQVPPRIAPYGITFGGGMRQCLGLRIVLGERDGTNSSHLGVLSLLLAAGIRPDPQDQSAVHPDERDYVARYPVVFYGLDARAHAGSRRH